MKTSFCTFHLLMYTHNVGAFLERTWAQRNGGTVQDFIVKFEDIIC